MVEHRHHLQAGQVRAHAEVGPDPEGEVRVRVAVDPERERVLEHIVVAVPGREEQRQLVALVDRHAVHLAVFHRGAGEVDDRRDVAQHLFDRAGEELGIALQALPLVAVLVEREQAAADRVAGGLVAGFDDELAVRQELHLGERLAVDLGGDELAHDVVARLAPVPLDQLGEIGVHLDAGAAQGLPGALARTAELGIVLADDLVRPSEQQLTVLGGHAEEPRDHRNAGEARRRAARSRTRSPPAAASAIPSSTSSASRSMSSLRALIARGVRRRIATRRSGTVTRGIEGDDHLDRLAGRGLRADHQPVLVRVPDRLRRDVEDVGVLRDRPERLVALGFEPRDRRLRAQLRPHVVGVAHVRRTAPDRRDRAGRSTRNGGHDRSSSRPLERGRGSRPTPAPRGSRRCRRRRRPARPRTGARAGPTRGHARGRRPRAPATPSPAGCGGCATARRGARATTRCARGTRAST